MNITMSAVGSIVSGLAAFFVAFSFACYVLFQKETLQVQIRKEVFFAFLPKEKADAFLKVCSLTYQTFANFLTGRCLEAVILWRYVCCYIEHFEDAICTFDRSFNCVYGIDPDFRSLHRVCGGKLFDLYGKSETGNFIYYSISGAAADRGNLIYPHVVGESVGLPSIWVLAAVTIGGNLMGIIGMLVFIPLLSVFYTIFREFVYLHLKKSISNR